MKILIFGPPKIQARGLQMRRDYDTVQSRNARSAGHRNCTEHAEAVAVQTQAEHLRVGPSSNLRALSTMGHGGVSKKVINLLTHLLNLFLFSAQFCALSTTTMSLVPSDKSKR